MNALDNFFLIALPYVALITFLIGSIYRYREKGFKVTSLSSQFIRGRSLFWGSVPFHWGLLVLFLGHLIGFLFPEGVLAWNSHPVRLIIIEVAAFIFGISVLMGLINLFYRRFTDDRVKVSSNNMDLIIELLLLLQVITGLWIAYNFRWGSSWFATVLTPYLRSIFVLQPDISAVKTLPWMTKLHIIGAYVVVLLIPFSRLIHILVAPLHYIGRRYQLVIWNRDRKKLHHPDTEWSPKRPQNN